MMSVTSPEECTVKEDVVLATSDPKFDDPRTIRVKVVILFAVNFQRRRI